MLIDNTIYFCRLHEPFGLLSNFAPTPFRFIDKYGRELYFQTNEHFYQYHKAFYEPDANLILNAKTPYEAAKIGRSCEIVQNWDRYKDSVMYIGLMLKFGQNKNCRNELFSTKDYIIAELSKKDFYWGTSLEREGNNVLGKLLMKVREHYKQEYIYNEWFEYYYKGAK